MKTVRAQIDDLVGTTGSHLADLYGIGPVIAGRILAEVETIDRFPTKDHFASYNGTAPIDASSGDQVRHRLSRAGNRRINRALHLMAVTQIRYPGSAGRGYYERKRLEGKTPKEALRCLKRRLSDVVYPADARRPRPPGQATGRRHNRCVRISYDRDADAAYIRLGDAAPSAQRATTRALTPAGVDDGFIALDWEDGRLVGIEVLDASIRLTREVLEQAEHLS